MKILIVDDEALARKLLTEYAKQIPDLEVVETYANALDAQSYLEKESIDLLFLDIEMPNLTGIEFLKLIKQRPLTVLTTAYSDYAIQGYSLDVIDYLLKPIPFERFFQAVQKAKERLKLKLQLPEVPNRQEEQAFLFVKTDYKIVKVNVQEILFIEGLREYVRIHTQQGQIITLLAMNKLEEQLPSHQFCRVHRSYIVNIRQIDMIQGNLIAIGNTQITVSKSQKEKFMALIQKNGIF